MADPVRLTEDGAMPRETASAPGADSRDARGLGFAETWRALRRRRLTVLLTTVLGLLVAVLIVSRITPEYTAKATVMLDAREANVVDFEEVLSGLPRDEDTVNSEILVVRSPVLAASVARDLNLAADPEFNPDISGDGGILDTIGLGGIADFFGGARSTGPLVEEARIAVIHDAVIEQVMARLNVNRIGRSRALDIRFTATSPDLAARFANGLADAYLADQLRAKRQATAGAQTYLDARVQELRDRVNASERRIEEYRIRAGLIGDQGATVADQQLSEINTQLVLAQVGRAEADARLAQVRRLVRSGRPEAASEVLASQLIVNLRGRETAAEQQIAELAEEYGARHPRMIGARAELQDIQGRIAAEVGKIVTSLENDVAVARAREAALARNVGALEQTAANQGAAEVQLRALEREADAARSLFQLFLSRASETETQTELQTPDARILARAAPPSSPAFPDPMIILPIAGVLSLIIGMALALMQEQLDEGYRSGEEAELDLATSLMALVPRVSRKRGLGVAPEKYALARPGSAFAESLRSIDTGLRLFDVDSSPRSVLITSALPNEGKSTLAMSLGRLLAKGGRPVLLLEADMRRPQAARTLGLPDTGGLLEVLLGEVSEHDVIQVDPESGLHVMAAGGADVQSPPNLLGSQPMNDLLRRLETNYDLVIIDTAPLMVVSDARALARHVDAVLFVVRWASTRRQIARGALRQLLDAGARVAGVVLTQVDVRRLAQYAYGDKGAYVRAAKEYYED